MAIDYGSAAKYQQALEQRLASGGAGGSGSTSSLWGNQTWTTTATAANLIYYYTPGYSLPIEEKKDPVPESALAWLDRRVQEMRVAL